MISFKKINLWSDVLANVISKNFSTDSINELLQSLESMLDGSSGMITLYPYLGTPQTTHHRLLANEDPNLHISTYEDGAYLLDPFYRHALDNKQEGVFKLDDVAPEGFKESEYYSVFYEKSGFEDEICIMFQLNDKSILSISVVKHNIHQNFNLENLAFIENTFNLLKSVFTQWLQTYEANFDGSFEGHLEHALGSFGSSLLTPKECEILHFVLHGYSVKYIAEKLENSVETIKHHRKNIYLKLDVTSQSELFYLFIASLKALPKGSKDDPLSFI